jgi:uncharacterized protein YjdB
MQAINSLLSSIADEEIALAHIIDAEAKKLKTIISDKNKDVANLMDANKSVERMLRKVITKEMLLSFQLEDVVELEKINAARPDFPDRILMPIDRGDLFVGGSLRLSTTLYPFNAHNRSIAWSSSDPAIAAVTQDGLVFALSQGNVIITAQTANNLTATCQLNIEEILPSIIELNRNSLNLGISRTEQLKVNLLPLNTTSASIQWSSDEMAIATVDSDGLVTAHSPGVARITAETVNQLSAYCDVTVSQVMPTDITIVPRDLTLEVGNSHTLFANVLPNDATNKNVIWTSANDTIASINPDRLVIAHQVGEVYINAITTNGLQAQCRVVVT